MQNIGTRRFRERESEPLTFFSRKAPMRIMNRINIMCPLENQEIAPKIEGTYIFLEHKHSVTHSEINCH